MSTVNGWIMFPSGRWAKTMNSHGGHIALHAFVSGSWAITRGGMTLEKGDEFIDGSREEGSPIAQDLEGAMKLAEDAAAAGPKRSEHTPPPSREEDKMNSGDFVRCNHYVTKEPLLGYYVGLMDSRYGSYHWAMTKYGKTGVIDVRLATEEDERSYSIGVIRKQIEEKGPEARYAMSHAKSLMEDLSDLRQQLRAALAIGTAGAKRRVRNEVKDGTRGKRGPKVTPKPRKS